MHIERIYKPDIECQLRAIVRVLRVSVILLKLFS